MTTTQPQDQPTPLGIDTRLSAVALRAPEASREDSRPQAILKFQCPSSLDYYGKIDGCSLDGSSLSEINVS